MSNKVMRAHLAVCINSMPVSVATGLTCGGAPQWSKPSVVTAVKTLIVKNFCVYNFFLGNGGYR